MTYERPSGALRIGQKEEDRIVALRKIRNQVAHAPDEPSLEEAERYEDEVRKLEARILGTEEDHC